MLATVKPLTEFFSCVPYSFMLIWNFLRITRKQNVWIFSCPTTGLGMSLHFLQPFSCGPRLIHPVKGRHQAQGRGKPQVPHGIRRLSYITRLRDQLRVARTEWPGGKPESEDGQPVADDRWSLYRLQWEKAALLYTWGGEYAPAHKYFSKYQ